MHLAKAFLRPFRTHELPVTGAAKNHRPGPARINPCHERHLVTQTRGLLTENLQRVPDTVSPSA